MVNVQGLCCIVGSGKYKYFSYRLLSVDTTALALSLLVLKYCMLGFARRMKNRCLSSEEQSQIVGMHKASAKGVEIATKLCHPKTTVYTVIKRFESCGTVEEPKSNGRPRKLSERSCRIMTCALLTNRRQILTNITNQSGLDVSRWCVRNALHESGFYNRVAQKKPFLTDAHKPKRLGFAFAHRKWTSEEWEKVIWIDESTFEVRKTLRQITVWQKSDECYNLDCSIPTFKSGRTSIIVWGAFPAIHKLLLIAMHYASR